MRIVAMSDSHGAHDYINVPDGDVFIHAGDFTGMGREEEVKSFSRFVDKLPHKHKIVIAGNHEVSFARDKENARQWLGDVCTYLENSGTEVEGVRFWGSPVQPFFDATGTWVFGEHSLERNRIWNQIPEETDVLITHGPPWKILDRTLTQQDVGCKFLRGVIERIRPKIHIFGHIHEAWGQEKKGDTQFLNVSVLDINYQIAHGCTVIDYK